MNAAVSVHFCSTGSECSGTRVSAWLHHTCQSRQLVSDQCVSCYSVRSSLTARSGHPPAMTDLAIYLPWQIWPSTCHDSHSSATSLLSFFASHASDIRKIGVCTHFQKYHWTFPAVSKNGSSSSKIATEWNPLHVLRIAVWQQSMSGQLSSFILYNLELSSPGFLFPHKNHLRSDCFMSIAEAAAVVTPSQTRKSWRQRSVLLFQYSCEKLSDPDL